MVSSLLEEQTFRFCKHLLAKQIFFNYQKIPEECQGIAKGNAYGICAN
jgi:hypothetical protein